MTRFGVTLLASAKRFASQRNCRLLLALGLVVSAHEARASGLSSSDLVVGIINTSGLCNGSQTISNTGAGSVPRVSCGGATWSETASASSQFGSLRALADLRFTGFNFATDTYQAFFQAKAEAGFTDTLTFSKGAFWDFTVSVSGPSVSVDANGVARNTNVGWCFNPFGAGCGISPYGVQTLGTQTYRYRIPANGIVNLSADLTIDLSADMRLDGSGSPPPYLPLTGDSYADLSHTVQFVSSRVLDSNGQPISDAIVSSQSGYDYVTPVPEPTSFASLSLGLVGFALLRRSLGSAPRGQTLASR